jgi:hypothetical protein
LPHSSIGAGRRRATLSAAGLMRPGSIRLFTKGAPRASARPLLHAAEANALKSPLNMAAVGSYAT